MKNSLLVLGGLLALLFPGMLTYSGCAEIPNPCYDSSSVIKSSSSSHTCHPQATVSAIPINSTDVLVTCTCREKKP